MQRRQWWCDALVEIVAGRDVELQQAAAQVSLLQQPVQLRHHAGLRLRARVLDRGQRHALVRSGEYRPLTHLGREHILNRFGVVC